MQNDIKKILETTDNTRFATDTGQRIHALLSHVFIGVDSFCGDKHIIDKIMQNSELVHIFSSLSKTEVPIAGFINGRFISRRIDRLLIDDENKQIWILDYKTDINHEKFINEYRNQLQEYAKLIHQMYPKYKINTCILWTHNWMLEYV